MNRGWKNKNRLQENYFDFFLLQRSSAHLLAKTVPPARFFLLRSPLRVRIPLSKKSTAPLGRFYSPQAHNREKLVAQRRRYVCACKRIAAASEIFHGRGGMTERMNDFSAKKNRNGVQSIPTWWR